jgi:hypothetical protein
MAETTKKRERPQPAPRSERRPPAAETPARTTPEGPAHQIRPLPNGVPSNTVGPMGGNGRGLQRLQQAAGNRAMSRLLEQGANGQTDESAVTGEPPAGVTTQAPTEPKTPKDATATPQTEQKASASPVEAPLPAPLETAVTPPSNGQTGSARPVPAPAGDTAERTDTAVDESTVVQEEIDSGAKANGKAPAAPPPAEGEMGAAGADGAEAKETEKSAKEEGEVAPEEGGDKAKAKGEEKAAETEEGAAETEAAPAGAAPLAEMPPPTEHVFEWTSEMIEDLAMPPQEELGEVDYDPMQARAEAAMKLANLQGLAQARSMQMMAETAVAIAQVQAQGFTSIANVQQLVETQVALVQAQYAAAREAVLAEAKVRKQLVTALVLLGYGQAIVQSIKTGLAIQLHAATYKDKARQAVKTRQDAAKKHGQDEGQRGKKAIDAQAEEARRRGHSKAAGYPNTERGQAQASAVLKVAEEVAAELATPGPDLEAETIKAGNEMAAGMSGAEAEVISGINQMALTTAVQIGAQTVGLKQQFDNLEKGLHAQIDVFALTMMINLSMAEAMAVAQLRLLAAQAIPQLLTAVFQYQAIALGEQAGATGYIDQVVASITAAIMAEERPDPDVVAKLIDYGERAVEGMAAHYSEQLQVGQTAVLAGLLEAEIAFMLGALAIGSAAQTTAAGMRGQATAGFNALVGVAQSGTLALNLGWSMALTSLEIATITEFNKAVTGMEAELDKGLNEGKQEITKTVDEAVKKNGEPLNELDAKLEEAARKAREEYDAAWYEKFFTWSFWGDVLWAIGKALLTFVLVIVAIVVGIILIIAGIILIILGAVKLGIALLVIGIILALGAVIYVVWGILENIYQRWQSATGFWQSAWAIVVGILDITGLPNIIEGISGYDIVNGRKLTDEEAAARLGNGIFNLVVLLIPFVLRGSKPKGGGAGKKPPKALPPGPKPPKALPPGPKPPKALPPGPKPPKALPPGPKPPKALPPGPKPPKALPPGPKPPKKGPPGRKPPKKKPPKPGEVPSSWKKFDPKHHAEFKEKLQEFRGNEKLEPQFSGGEGRIFLSGLKPFQALKRWFMKRLKDMPDSIKKLEDAKKAVEADAALKKDVDVVKMHEKGSDWIRRDFDPTSIPLKDALGDANASAARARVLEALKDTKDPILKDFLKKLEREPPSENLHWSTNQQKILIIDMQ